jgi:L-seryl-tRNA(Ser) seleniumtransferase
MTTMDDELRERLRRIPGVDKVLERLAQDPPPVGVDIRTRMARQVLTELRARLRDRSAVREEDCGVDAIAERVRADLQDLLAVRPEPVINATGVLVHTNLGRSPLSAPAVAHVARVAAGYSDLEFDLEAGARGSRDQHVVDLLRILTGAEDALVVNNNAAAVLLALAAVARAREVVVSRGELVEIGGSFRIPEILEQSGALLREVGTTNRTHRRDFEAALGPETGLLLKVHTSNYRVSGFTAEVGVEEMVALGGEGGIPVLVDVGSGALLSVPPGSPRPEPRVQDLVASGVDLVTFSGDKLLGGPQAGCVVGKRELIGHLRRHPLARVVRIDKLLLAGLQATLVAYLEEERARREIPVLRMLSEAPEVGRERADRFARALSGLFPEPPPLVMVESSEAPVGGGSLPLEELPSTVVVLDPRPRVSAARLERALRHVRPAVLGRIREERLLLDLRTVAVEEEGQLPGLVLEAWTTAIGEGA